MKKWFLFSFIRLNLCINSFNIHIKKKFKIDFIRIILNSLRARAESEIKIFVLHFSIDMKSIYFSSIIIDLIQSLFSLFNEQCKIEERRGLNIYFRDDKNIKYFIENLQILEIEIQSPKRLHLELRKIKLYWISIMNNHLISNQILTK